MEDNNRTMDPGAGGEYPNSQQPPEGEGVPVSSRIRSTVEDLKRRLSEEMNQDRDVVLEYEERYHGRSRTRLEEQPPSTAEPITPSGVYMPAKPKRQHDPASVDANERKWAALAHASTLLTAVMALGSLGLGVLITMFIPLLIYFSFRKRSEYVAFHALQALTIQLIGTIGWLSLVTVGLIVWAALLVISLLLVLVLVGIVLLPLVLLAGPILLVISLALPLGMVIYSVIALTETRSGHNYRFPYIARWVESQMHGGSLLTF
jgi:uncharacterized Tic20 family protein